MKNPIFVFVFSLDHKSRMLNKILAKIGLYENIAPVPFEYYCVFCAKYICDTWWRKKKNFSSDNPWGKEE